MAIILRNTLIFALIFTIHSLFPTTVTSSVSDVASRSFFDKIIDKAGPSCAGKKFYTYEAFLGAVSMYPKFGTSLGSDDDNKREIAAFFAHVSHETDNLCHIEEKDGNVATDYCDPGYPLYPCTPGKKYYGRGPLQLTHNYNYGGAGKELHFDGLNDPEKVANDVDISFKASMWYWMTNVHSVVNKGFGATIRKINGGSECDGKNKDEVQNRVQFYQMYCSDFGVAPGDKISCS